jgi:hypothetical protein
VVGSLDYDPALVGFLWDSGLLVSIRAKDPVATVVDTTQDSLSNVGHDRDIRGEGGKLLKLDWSRMEDRDDFAALMEYLKTL